MMSALSSTQPIPELQARIWSAIQSRPPALAVVWRDELWPELGRTLVQDAYVAAFWPYIEQQASRYARAGGDRDDLIGEGALALWESAVSYTPQKHRTRFSDYVKNNVHRRIRRAYLAHKGYMRSSIGQTALDERMPVPEDALDAAESSLDVAQAIRSLSRRDQQALLDPRSSETHRKRRQRARMRLKRALAGHPRA